MNKVLGKYSFGAGDRFAHQAEAQLNAIIMAGEKGIDITPVWNKSFREHKTIGSVPLDTRRAADIAVEKMNWRGAYFADADHVNAGNIESFLDPCDFFTIDVADYIGKPAGIDSVTKFIEKNSNWIGNLSIPGIGQPYVITREQLTDIANNYLFAVQEAAKLFKFISEKKNGQSFVTEVSMDETENPQSPLEIFFILAALSYEGVPVDTIAPKFSGRFNKGVNYVGDVSQFEKEFEEDVLVLKYAIEKFNLPAGLKLSIHSGSDKFSIYPVMNKIIKKYDVGLHVKTAGTTWLEELIGLAEAGGEGLDIAREVYSGAFNRFDELTSPYATVIDIDKNKLPSVDEVNSWEGKRYADTLRHDLSNAEYNPHFRQLLHVGYKVAAELDKRYTDALVKYQEIISENVTENLLVRHIEKIFSN